MKITCRSGQGGLSIRLTAKETSWLNHILARYNAGEGTMAQQPNGFPLELLKAIEKVVSD